MSRQSCYNSKIEKILNHIRHNLTSDLSVNSLAQVVHLSPYHFHRVYSSLTNETIYDTILRMRMESAVIQLSKYPDKSIIEIAFDVGFQNPSSFSRAFKRYFGFSPKDAQKNKAVENSKIGILKSKYGKELTIKDLYTEDVFNIQGDRKMNVEIKNFPEQPVVFLSSNYTHDQAMGSWLKLHKLYQENKGGFINEFNTIGLYYHDPTVTPLDKCQSDLCLITSQPVDIKPPFSAKSIPAGKYAVATYVVKEEHKDKWTDKEFEAKDMNNFIQSFYKNWLVESGHEADNYPLLMAHKVVNDQPLKDEHGNPYFDVVSIDIMIKLK